MNSDERRVMLDNLSDNAESFTDYCLYTIAGYDKPWSTVAVVAILAFAMAVGGYLF